MKRCRVIGHVVANAKHPVLEGQKIMVVKPEPDGPMQLALDGVVAGIGSLVIVAESGTAGAHVTWWDFPPARSVIVGIIDD